MKLKSNAQDAKPMYGEDMAWYYENRGSIEVLIQKGGVILSAKITRAKLKDWIKRTEPKAER